MAMTTQRINIDINTTPVEPIVMRVGESYNRVFEFVLGRYDDDVFVPLSYTWESELEPVRAKFRLVKPDKTFVIDDMIVTQDTDGKKVFSILQTPEMSQVGGVGYYDIRVCNTSDDAEFAYSVQGKCIIDDDMITDEMIESVASSNGYIFPDEFLTIEDFNPDDYATKQYVDDAIAAIPKPLDIFSAEERVVGTWIDGSTLYQKTITVNGFDANISDDRIGCYYGVVTLTPYVVNTPHLMVDLMHSYIILADNTIRIPMYGDWQDGDDVSIYFPFVRRTGTLILTIQYTKTN
jgi:hypothetical protein